MRKIYILGLISTLLLINFVSACSYPSIVDCNTREELGIVIEEWTNGDCTFEEMMECAEIWTDYDRPTFPKFDGWYCGDTHYHTNYTNVNWEKGWSIPKTSKEAAKVGLDFFFVTDHSNSIKYLGGNETWNNFKNECNGYSNCLIGNEINCDYTDIVWPPYFTGRGNHLLAYDYPSYIDDGSASYLGFQLPTNITPSCLDVINYINLQDGFTYAAHPESVGGESSNLTFSTWKNYSLPFNGLEIWNGDLEDPQVREDLEKGLNKWRSLTLNGRKVFISGGTDTHAAGCGLFRSDCNSSFAKVATCVNANSFSKSNIIDAFKNGKSYVTNNGVLILEVWSPKDLERREIVKGYFGDTIDVCEKLSFHIDFKYNVSEPCTLYVYEGDIESGIEREIDNARLLSDEDEDGFIWNGFDSDNLYYRAMCKSSDSKKRIYTNPIWVNVDTNDKDNDNICDTYDTIDNNIIPQSGMEITRNTIFKYGSYTLPEGITVNGNNIFVDCNSSTIIGNTGGLYVVGGPTGIKITSHNVTVKNCKVTNYSYGIFSSSDLLDYNYLLNNEVYGNWHGIEVVNMNKVQYNEIHDNNKFGVVVDSEMDASSMQIQYNDIYDNSDYYIRNGLSGNVSAENNWWGTTNETGISNKIYDYHDDSSIGIVTFIPYSDKPFTFVPKRNVQISARLDPTTPRAFAEEEVIIIATINNTGEIITTYNISLNGTEEWSTLTAIEPEIVTLDIGLSADVKIYLDLNEDSGGEKIFTIQVAYDNKTTRQPVSLIITMKGDVNGNCKVDIFDLAAVGLSYGSKSGDGNWNSNADLNNDGKISIIDLATIGLNYGKVC